MDLDYLRCFLIVAEEMNLTRAAGRLEIAQPHLTRLIHRLEEELGFLLFDRSNKRQLAFTPAGEAFRAEIVPLLSQYDHVVQVAQRISRGEVGKLVVGYTGAAMLSVLPAILQEWRQRCEAEVIARDVSTTARSALLRALREGHLEVALVLSADDAPGIAHECVCQAPLRVVLPATHPLTRLEAIPLAALEKETWLWFPRHLYPSFYDDIIALCHQAGFHPQIEHLGSQAQAAVSLVAAQAGISLLTQWSEQSLPHQAIVYRPLVDVTYQAELHVLWRKEERSPLVQAFLQVVREVSEKLDHPSEQKETSE